MLKQASQVCTSLIEQDFKYHHLHGQVRRFARDTSDRLRTLPRFVFSPTHWGQRQLLARVPIRQNLCLT